MQRKSCSIYASSRGFLVAEIVKLIGFCVFAAYIFYDSFLGVVAFLPVCIALYVFDRHTYICSQKRRVRQEFKDVITFLSGNLNAGYSLENGFSRAAADMGKLYSGGFLLERDIRQILYGISCNIGIEELLIRLADRTDIAEIRDCAEFIGITKRHGGDTVAVIKQISSHMSEQLMTEREIDATIAAKRLEGRIMLVMPFAIIAYMRLTNPGYMDMLYNTLAGRSIMTGAVLFIFLSGGLIYRITEIEV